MILSRLFRRCTLSGYRPSNLQLARRCSLYFRYGFTVIAALSGLLVITACTQTVTQQLPSPVTSPPSFPAASAIAAPPLTQEANFPPFGTIQFPTDSPVVAGAPHILEVRLRASEPTQWQATAFTSTCGVTALPAAFTADNQSAHTILTTVSIPVTAAGATCTIHSEVTAIGKHFPHTPITLHLEFPVLAK